VSVSAAQQEILTGRGVAEDRAHLDHGLAGTKRARPDLDLAPAAVRAGDALVVPKLDRLACSVHGAREIGDFLVARGVRVPPRRGGLAQTGDSAARVAGGEQASLALS
jgi:DNA invertase Pin-like site-specific DNA recombinase